MGQLFDRGIFNTLYSSILKAGAFNRQTAQAGAVNPHKFSIRFHDRFRISNFESRAMHGKFTPRDRAAARTKFSYAWSVSNAPKGGRGETLSVANGCSIIEET